MSIADSTGPAPTQGRLIPGSSRVFTKNVVYRNVLHWYVPLFDFIFNMLNDNLINFSDAEIELPTEIAAYIPRCAEQDADPKMRIARNFFFVILG